MDNPHHAARIRRRTSMPSRLHRRSSLLPARLRVNRNPYVGSFRHSPPTSFVSMAAGLRCPQQCYLFPSSQPPPPQPSMRNSPYVGWFRHAPPSSVRLQKIDYRDIALHEKCQALAMILASLKEGSRPPFASIVNGRLCGGGTEKGYDIYSSTGTTYQDSPNMAPEKPSDYGKMLAKLGAWLLYPLAQDAESLYQACYYDRNLKLLTQDTRQVDDDDGSDSETEDEQHVNDEDDNDDDSSVALSDFDRPSTPVSRIPPPSGSTSTCSTKPLDVSVSEIAEAYYAHQVIDQSEYSFEVGDRLDYVITQADIARMARNAARHLDVDSILSLPTTTFRSQKRIVKNISESNNTMNMTTESRDPDEAWSFIMVPQNATGSKSTDNTGVDNTCKETGTVCVICLEAFVDGDRLRVLPCDHSFHVGCIDRWLSGSHSHNECFTSGCPTCKKRPANDDNDGSVPSWAFAKIGSQMMTQSFQE